MLAALEIQVAVLAILRANAPLTAMLTGIYDDAPPDALYPFLSLGPHTENSNQTVATFGHNNADISFQMHVYAKDVDAANTIASLIEDALRTTRGGFRATTPSYEVSGRFEWDAPTRDPNRQIRHIPMRFRMWAFEK